MRLVLGLGFRVTDGVISISVRVRVAMKDKFLS